MIADLDFETYSEAGFVWDAAANRWKCLPRASQGKKGLSVVQAARYAEHPTTEVLCLAYTTNEAGDVGLWTPQTITPPLDLFRHIAAGGLLRAWNVWFERCIWENVCVPRLGWPPVPAGQWRCAMAQARAFSLPGGLEAAGTVLGLDVTKDKTGTRLLNKFSIPRNPTKADARLRIRPEHDSEGPMLYNYCIQDVRAQRAVVEHLPEWSES